MMERGTKLIHNPTGNAYSETLIFDQVIGEKIMAITEDGLIRIINPDDCQLADPKGYLNPPKPMCG